MKLSDIKGDRVLDVIAEIIDPIANIAEDKDAVALFKRETLQAGEDAKKQAIKRLKDGVPKLLKHHKKDIIKILSAIEGVPEKEYENNLNLPKLIKDVSELLTDQTFIELFMPAQTIEK